MTYIAIIFFNVLSIVILGMCTLFGWFGETRKSTFIGFFIGLAICLIIWSIALWYYNSTEAGKRARKTQESNFNGGITRVVKVYDVEGDLIAEYTGKFDVDYDNDRIIFDDENDNRHIIYYPTGTVIIDEVDE